MFSLFGKKQRASITDLAGIGVDMHSHLIPGIDDGAPDMATSLELIRGLVGLGYRKLITTPHIYSDLYPNTPEVILTGLGNVRAALEKEQIAVQLDAAAEYMLDDMFVRALEEGKQLLTLKDNLILVELSFAVPTINLKDILFNIQLRGMLPVLAHPERYLYFGANKTMYDQLRDAGCLFQVNLLSLIGYYGKGPQELANFLVKKNYVDLLGTDLHHVRHLEMLTGSRELLTTVGKLLDGGNIRNSSMLG